MIRQAGLILLALVTASVAQVVSATAYTQFLESGGWKTEGTIYSCTMTHTVPFFGDAVFATRAGERSHFFLDADVSRLKAGKAVLVSRAPVWTEQKKVVKLGDVTVTQEYHPVNLMASSTERMLVELYNGRELVFTGKPWYGDEKLSEIAITTVGFRAVYERYLECLAGLLPANFDQLRRTSVYFGSNQYENFPLSELRKLDNIAALFKVDPSIKQFFIDGHTDDVGTTEANIVLAQKRAQEVTRYLIDRGIPEKAIISRWHGERYPVAENNSVQNRSKNRRVTVRLEKDIEPRPVLDAPQSASASAQ